MVPSSPVDANARCVDVLACFSRDDQKRNGWEPEGSGIRSIEAVPKMKSYRRCDLKIQPYPFSFFFCRAEIEKNKPGDIKIKFPESKKMSSKFTSCRQKIKCRNFGKSSFN